jgi:MFS family permease
MAKKNIDEDEDFEDEPRKKKGTQSKTKKGRKKVELKDETRHSIWGITLFVFALLIVLSFFGGAGIAGNFLQTILNSFFGIGYYLLPVLLAVVGYSFMKNGRPQVATLHAICGLGVLLSTLAILDLAQNGAGATTSITLGGYLGSIFAWPFVKIFGLYASLLTLGALLIISLIVLFDEKPQLATFWPRLKQFFTRKISLPAFNKSNTESDYQEEEHTEAKPTPPSTQEYEQEDYEESRIRRRIHPDQKEKENFWCLCSPTNDTARARQRQAKCRRH